MFKHFISSSEIQEKLLYRLIVSFREFINISIPYKV